MLGNTKMHSVAPNINVQLSFFCRKKLNLKNPQVPRGTFFVKEQFRFKILCVSKGGVSKGGVSKEAGQGGGGGGVIHVLVINNFSSHEK